MLFADLISLLVETKKIVWQVAYPLGGRQFKRMHAILLALTTLLLQVFLPVV
jgi:hypothetical protein